MNRALVTGITGFVGSHLARALLDDEVEVHAILRPEAHLDRIPDLAGRFTAHTDDGSVATLARIVAIAQPDCTFHLATNFVAVHQADDVTPLVLDNIGFPTRLADALASAGHRSLVHVGTAWQHVEGEPYRPKNLYAATKQAYDDILRFYSDTGRLEVVTVKLYDSYGPLDHRAKVLNALLDAVRTGNSLDMSSGVQLVDLVHIEDVVAALLLAATMAGGSYAVSSGQPRTLRELVDVIGRVAGTPLAVTWGARPDREGDMVSHWAAGPALPGWSPRVVLEDGLARLLS